MCGTHACGCHGPLVVNQAEDSLKIWGPFSAELPSADKPVPKLIRLQAVRNALPQIIKRGRFSVKHHDQIVGEIVPLLELDASRVAKEETVQAMVKELVSSHGGLPTAILPVSPAIAAVFPRLKPLMGKEVAFAGGTIFGDNPTGKLVMKDIVAGRLDAFSISGTTFHTAEAEYCDATGCRNVELIEEMDGSAITIGSSRGGTGSDFDAKTMNPAASFVVVQQTTPSPATLDGGNRQALKEAESIGASGSTMTTKETVQTAPAATTAAPAAITQTPAPAPAAPKVEEKKQIGPGDAPEGVADVLAQIMRRLEDLEKAFASMTAPAPAPEAPPEAAPQAKAEPAKEDLKALVANAVKEAVAKIEPVKQAAPARVVQTPEPAEPGGTGDSDKEIKLLLQAIDDGRPGALKDMVRHVFRNG